MHVTIARPRPTTSWLRVPARIPHALLPPLLFLVLAIVPFWQPLVRPDRIAVSADIIANVSAPWSDMPIRARPRNGLQGDAVMLLLPMRRFARDELLAGHFPLWNPYALGGAPFFANDQSAVLSPLDLLTLPLPLTTGWAVLAVLKLFLAGCGTYLYVRALGVRRIAATFAGVAFMASAPIVNWVHWPLVSVAICLPWLFWGTEQLVRARDERRAAWLVSIAGVVATQFYAGHIETSLHILLATGLYMLFRAVQAGRKSPQVFHLLELCAAAVVLGTGLAAVQLVPTAETLRQSAIARDRATQTIFQLPMEYLLSWLIPNFWGSGVFTGRNIEWGIRNAYETTGYVGVPCLVLAAIAWRTNRAQRSTILFFAGVILLALALVYDVPLIGALARLPILRVALNIRLVSVIGFALAVLAALGLDGLLTRVGARERDRRPFRKWPARALLGVTGALVIAAYAVTPRAITRLFMTLAPYRDLPDHAAWDWLWAVAAALWLALTTTAIITCIRGAIAPRVGSAVLLLTLIADLALYGAHMNPSDDARLLFPETAAITDIRSAIGGDRMAGYLDTVRPNAATWLGMRDLRAYDPTASRRVTSYLQAAALADPLNGQPAQPVNPAFLAMAGVRLYVGPAQAPVFTQQGNEMDGHVIAGARDETEWFFAPADGLTAIELFITPLAPAPVPLQLTLRDPAGTVLARETVTTCTTRAGCPIRFTFAPLLHSANHGYGVTLAAPSVPPEQGVSPWFTREPDDQYAAGRLIAGQPTPGALYFRLFAAPGAGMPVSWSEGSVQAWSVPAVRPRAYFASNIVPVHDEASALAVIPEIATTPGAVVIEGSTPATSVVGSTVTVATDRPGDITLGTVHHGGDGLLVLNETSDPGWRATVDGHTVRILLVNGIAQGVIVPEGEHTVRFVYAPRSVFIGGIVSGMAAFVSVVILGWSWMRRRTASPPCPLSIADRPG